MRINLVFIFFLCSTFQLFAQTVSPYTLNNGGGSSTNLEWNVAEAEAVSQFSANRILLTTGLLHPLATVITAMEEYDPLIFGDQITIGPNPVERMMSIKARFDQEGTFAFQLLDSRPALLFSFESDQKGINFEREVDLGSQAVGVYFLRVYFKPHFGSIKTAIYKVLKVN